MHNESTVTIQLRGGLINALQQDGMVIARGVKYAEAARFEPPRIRNTKWDGIIDCTRPATICPQPASRLEAINGPITAGHSLDEDCLHVSVFSQNLPKQGDLLPVMVFIHGGAYMTGAGDLDCYSGAPLASQGVVVVNITYRLGIFGYQPIKGIVPPNLGLLDQIAALQWIHDNIESFGGDPNRVCLFGESAGGDSIFCLLGADGVEGLFHRVILQSAPFGVRDLDRQDMVNSLSSMAGNFLPKDYESVPAEELLAIQAKLSTAALQFLTAGMSFAPCLGHSPLPEQSEFDTRLDQMIRRVPIFIGYTKDEGRPFEQIAKRIEPLSGLFADPSNKLTAGDFVTKRWFQEPADRFFQRINEAGGQAFLYQFNLAPEQSRFGAVHTIDLPFLLGTWDAWKDAPMMGGSDAREFVERMGSEVKRLWLAFAKGHDLGSRRFVIDDGFSFPTG
ncbi:putative N-octanoylanthranilate hydrolase AqdA2 [Cladobotryum mycophilum]|uniref:Carboxylic ester hydrolase n=1 Tax=Cladobotryum mycophilum TaxID=491253 RepID=A0ABR0SCF2_9HYPO